MPQERGRLLLSAYERAHRGGEPDIDHDIEPDDEQRQPAGDAQPDARQEPAILQHDDAEREGVEGGERRRRRAEHMQRRRQTERKRGVK